MSTRVQADQLRSILDRSNVQISNSNPAIRMDVGRRFSGSACCDLILKLAILVVFFNKI